MRIIFMVILLGACVLPSCYRRICPAYHSAFLLSDSLCTKCFSLFGEDSLPLPPPVVHKTRDGLIQRTSNQKISRRQRILLTKKLYPMPDSIASDSLQGAGADTLLVELADQDPVDGGIDDGIFLDEEDEIAAADETEETEEITDAIGEEITEEEEAPPTDQYRFGYDPEGDYEVDQETYMELFGDLLVVQAVAAEDTITAPDVEAEFEEIPDVYTGPTDETDTEETTEE